MNLLIPANTYYGNICSYIINDCYDCSPIRYMEKIINRGFEIYIHRTAFSGNIFDLNRDLIESKVNQYLRIPVIAADRKKAAIEDYIIKHNLLHRIIQFINNEPVKSIIDIELPENINDFNKLYEKTFLDDIKFFISGNLKKYGSAGDTLRSIPGVNSGKFHLKSILQNIYYNYDIFRSTENYLHRIEISMYNIHKFISAKRFEFAVKTINGFLYEIAYIENLDDAYRLRLIMDFINNYERLYNDAFYSALERRDEINRKKINGKIHICMMLGDIIPVIRMSALRLSLASVFLKGDNLVEYRAETAAEDLKRAYVIEESIDRSFDNVMHEDYLIEAYSLVTAWIIILLSHIEAGHQLLTAKSNKIIQ